MRKIAITIAVTFLASILFGSALFAEEAKEGKEIKEVKEEVAPPKPKPFVEDRVAKEGDEAIDFALFDITGENLVKFEEISKKSKKLTAVVFLNSTCVSCRNEAELLANMKKKYKDDLLLLAIITDMNPKIFDKTASEGVKNAFMVVHDPQFLLPPAYGFNFTPALVLIKNGKVDKMKGGFVPGKDDMAVVKLIKGSM